MFAAEHAFRQAAELPWLPLVADGKTAHGYAVHLLDGKRYSAQLRSEGERAYWRVPGQSPLPGKYEPPEFRFEYESLVARTQDDAGTPICRLVQSEVLTGRVKPSEGDADTPDADAAAVLEGEHVMTVSAEPGANCASALAPAGAFEKLPCELHYTLTGERTKSF